MKRWYDLHIHSCLSPCGADDMTPADIAGMAYIKGLSLIAVTDHNASFNLPAAALAAAEYGMVFVPGIEVTTSEEIHVLTYFRNVDAASDFGDMLYQSLPDIPNRPDIFGRQIVMDAGDNKTGEPDKLLLQATPFPIDAIVQMARDADGCAVPAHINRDSFSVFANLGFLPPGLFGCVEIAAGLPCPALDAGLRRLYSSDAHTLGAISEPEHSLEGIENASDFVDFINNRR